MRDLGIDSMNVCLALVCKVKDYVDDLKRKTIGKHENKEMREQFSKDSSFIQKVWNIQGKCSRDPKIIQRKKIKDYLLFP